MNKIQKKIILITGLTLAGAVISSALTYIATLLVGHPTFSDHYEIKHLVLIKILTSIGYLLKPFEYEVPWAYLFDEFSFIFEYLPLLVAAVLLIGLIQFIRSNGKKTRLMRFVFGLYFAFRFFSLIIYLITVVLFPLISASNNLSDMPWFYVLLTIAGHILWALVSAWVLRELQQYSRISVTQVRYNDMDREEFVVAKKSQRFLNDLIDGLVLVLLLMTLLYSVIALCSGFDETLAKLITILVGMVLRFFYFVTFESIWSATPGKFLTGTIVADENGKKPGFRQVLGRTFARFIPFDALSFFGSRGWHDSLSDTWVCREEIKEEEAQLNPES